MSGSVSLVDGHIDEVTTGKTCKDCLYYECCSSLNKEFKKYPKDYIGSDLVARNCSTFKDKSRFVELPCKVGDTVYQVGTDGILYSIEITKMIYDTKGIAFDERAIGKTVFLTKEEAEVKLKELQNDR